VTVTVTVSRDSVLRAMVPASRRKPCHYCLGKVPESTRKPRVLQDGLRHHCVCLTMPGEPHEWFVAGYADPKEPQGDYNPFGHFFILVPWDVPGGGEIDDGMPRTYVRLTASWEVP